MLDRSAQIATEASNLVQKWCVFGAQSSDVAEKQSLVVVVVVFLSSLQPYCVEVAEIVLLREWSSFREVLAFRHRCCWLVTAVA